MRTLLSSPCQLRLEVKLNYLGYILTPELDSFIGTAHYRALPPLTLSSSLVPE